MHLWFTNKIFGWRVIAKCSFKDLYSFIPLHTHQITRFLSEKMWRPCVSSLKKYQRKFCLHALVQKRGHKIRTLDYIISVIKLNDVCKIHNTELDTQHILSNISTSLIKETVISHMKMMNQISWEFKEEERQFQLSLHISLFLSVCLSVSLCFSLTLESPLPHAPICSKSVLGSMWVSCLLHN